MRKVLMIGILLISVHVLSALTLEQAKRLALEKNPDYQAQVSSFKAARWSTHQSSGNLLPSLSVNGTYLYQKPATQITTDSNTITLNNDTRSFNLNLSQPVFLGGKLWQAYKISKDNEEIARLNLENSKLNIQSVVETKYLSVLQLMELLSISEKDLQSSRQNLDIAQVRYETGVLSAPEFMKIKSTLASKEVSLIQDQTSLELAKQDFINTLSLSEWTELQPVSLVADEKVIETVRNWDYERTYDFVAKSGRQAEKGNLNLQTAKQSVTIAKRSFSTAKGSFLPEIYLSLNRSFSEDGMGRYEYDVSNTLALKASLPLLPFLSNYSSTRKAYHEVQKSNYNYTSVGNSINLAVKSAALNLVSAAKQIKAAQIALDYTEMTYEQLMERYRSNLLSATDMLNAEVMLQSAQINHTNSYYNWFKAKTNLLLALGSDDLIMLETLIGE